jgi:hypothetical protein
MELEVDLLEGGVAVRSSADSSCMISRSEGCAAHWLINLRHVIYIERSI